LLQKARDKKKVDLNISVDHKLLTRPGVTKILGSSVPFNYQSGSEQRIYDEKICYWNASNYYPCLIQLFNAMMLITIRANNDIDCFWLVVKSKITTESLLLIVIPHNQRHKETRDKLHDKVFIHVPCGDALSRHTTNAFNPLINDAQINFDIDVVVVADASASELKRMNDFKSTLQSSLSILIPIIGNAKLTSVNCPVQDCDLLNLFYGDDNEVIQAKVNEKGGIPVQIKVMGCTISFDEATTSSGSSSSGDSGRSSGGSASKDKHAKASSHDKEYIDMDKLIQGHHHNEKQKQQHPYIDFVYDTNGINIDDGDDDTHQHASSTSSSPFIHDLPLGYRILNGCQQLIGKPKRKVLIIGSDDTSEKSSINKDNITINNNNSKTKDQSPKPGTAEYALAQKELLSTSEKDIDETGASCAKEKKLPRTDKIDISLKCIGPSWINVRSIKTTPSSADEYDMVNDHSDINAFLPKQSVFSCSVHLDHQPLFAMAYKTLIVGVEGTCSYTTCGYIISSLIL